MIDPGDPRITTVGGYILALTVVLILLGSMALITMRVFEQAAKGPAAMTVVVMLSFLTTASIVAAVVSEGSGKEFVTLAAAGIGALAGAVTGLYGPGGGGGPKSGED